MADKFPLCIDKSLSVCLSLPVPLHHPRKKYFGFSSFLCIWRIGCIMLLWRAPGFLHGFTLTKVETDLVFLLSISFCFYMHWIFFFFFLSLNAEYRMFGFLWFCIVPPFEGSSSFQHLGNSSRQSSCFPPWKRNHFNCSGWWRASKDVFLFQHILLLLS